MTSVRAALRTYGDRLDDLQWGEATDEVELHWQRTHFERLARDLNEGGEEWIRDPGDATSEARRRGEQMIATAEAITAALA